ncbi:MAG TPA: anti-sigma factor, partial [Ornithinibacter sp.]|nr:anti-sigma factor [Ornithinibacter sp.]
LRASVLQGVGRVRPMPPPSEPTEPVGPTEPVARMEPVARTEPVGPSEPVEPVTAAGGGSGGRVVPFVRRTSTWLAAAAAAVAIAVGGIIWSPWSDQPSSPYDQVVAAADATTVTSVKGDTTAKVVFSRQLGRSAISVTGLPSLPDDQTYQLWYADADEEMHPAGVFDTDASGRASTVLDGDANAAVAVGVTIEPAGGSPRPTTEPIMVMALA